MNTPQSEFTELFRYLRSLVNTKQLDIDPHSHFALVEAYWHVGRIVVETEQDGQERADYGIHLIELLSQQLTQAFGKGYSLPNMWRFKQFYLAFQILSTNGRELPNLRKQLRPELHWSHYRLLMQIQNLAEREFYVQKAADERWPVRVLQRLVHSRYYYHTALGEDHLLSGIKKISMPTPNGFSPTPSISDSLSSRTRLANIKKSLLEQHVGYAFVAQRQYISIMGEDHWVELVFFHFVMNRFMLVHLRNHDPADITLFKHLLDGYVAKQPPTMDKLPVGLLINPAGVVRIVTCNQETYLPFEEECILPRTLL